MRGMQVGFLVRILARALAPTGRSCITSTSRWVDRGVKRIWANSDSPTKPPSMKLSSMYKRVDVMSTVFRLAYSSMNSC